MESPIKLVSPITLCLHMTKLNKTGLKKHINEKWKIQDHILNF